MYIYNINESLSVKLLLEKLLCLWMDDCLAGGYMSHFNDVLNNLKENVFIYYILLKMIVFLFLTCL